MIPCAVCTGTSTTPTIERFAPLRVEVVVDAAAGFPSAVVLDDGKISESMPAVVGVVVARRVGSDADVQEVASRMNKQTNAHGYDTPPHHITSHHNTHMS